MEKILQGKNILVTGTARGMGHQMVETFAANGANVFAHARTSTDEQLAYCKEVADKYSVQVIPVFFELTDPEAIKAGVKEIRGYKVPINGLVNNAGITMNALFQMTRMEDLRNQFEVNFFAPFLLTQYITKLMVRSGGGSVVNIASTAGEDGNSGKSAYGSSKAALVCMTKAIAEELGENNIRANSILPGITATEMLSSMPDYIIDEEKSITALGEPGTPANIADTAAFLLSDYSSYITGQAIRVDGGVSTHIKVKKK